MRPFPIVREAVQGALRRDAVARARRDARRQVDVEYAADLDERLRTEFAGVPSTAR